MAQDPRGPRYSPDGQWWWDGTAWRPVAPQPGAQPTAGMSSGAIVAVIAAVAIVVLVTVSVLVFVAFKRINDSLVSTPIVGANAVPCDQLEHTQVHYHAELQILVDGRILPIPTDVGRTAGCYYWLHMHSGEPGMIHVEAPLDHRFTLADFFQVWSNWAGEKELLDQTHVSTITLGPAQKLAVYVDSGNGPKAFAGDPATVVLENREVITLEVTPPTVDPPPAYRWPAGF